MVLVHWLRFFSFSYDLCETWVHENGYWTNNLPTFSSRQNAKPPQFTICKRTHNIIFFFCSRSCRLYAANEILGLEKKILDHKESSVTRAPDNENKNEPRRVFVYLHSYVNIWISILTSALFYSRKQWKKKKNEYFIQLNGNRDASNAMYRHADKTPWLH